MALTFRFATEADTPLILNFIRALAKYEKMLDLVVADEALLADQLFQKRNAEVIFAVEDGKEVGFALFFQNFSTFLGRSGLYLEDLYVLPEFRGKGYGKKALEYIEEFAANRGCKRLQFQSEVTNPNAMEFYISQGYSPADMKFYVKYFEVV